MAVLPPLLCVFFRFSTISPLVTALFLEMLIHEILDSSGPKAFDHFLYFAVSHQHHNIPSRLTTLSKRAQPMSNNDHCVTPPRELIVDEALNY